MNTLTLLDSSVTSCNRCPLYESCNQPVAGVTIGASPQVLFVGEYPEVGEDIEGEAFVDRAGYNFRSILKESKIQSYRLTYIVKCKPASPKDAETGADTCPNWLHEEIEIMKPKVVLTLGKLPARILTNQKKSMRLEDYIGRTMEIGNHKTKFWYSVNYILNRGKSLRQQTLEVINGILD